VKKLNNIFQSIDQFVDSKFGLFLNFIRKHFIIFSSTLIVLFLLLLMFLFKTYYNKPYFISNLIKNDLKIINTALKKIDKQCNIIGIKNDRVILDFFTVKKFVGSEIGGLNLAYPQEWLGPYLDNNPVLQQKFYEIVKVQDGFFIIPGSGIKLPNGVTIDKEFQITSATSIQPMLMPGGNFFFKGVLLAKRITFKIGDWDSMFKAKKETVKEINKILNEFNTALPFSKNENSAAIESNVSYS
jgi:hypothetical protein